MEYSMQEHDSQKVLITNTMLTGDDVTATNSNYSSSPEFQGSNTTSEIPTSETPNTTSELFNTVPENPCGPEDDHIAAVGNLNETSAETTSTPETHEAMAESHRTSIPPDLAPPLYQVTEQNQGPSSPHDSRQNEAPPQYSDLPPDYSPRHSESGRFFGENAVSTLEEQRRLDALRNETSEVLDERAQRRAVARSGRQLLFGVMNPAFQSPDSVGLESAAVRADPVYQLPEKPVKRGPIIGCVIAIIVVAVVTMGTVFGIRQLHDGSSGLKSANLSTTSWLQSTTELARTTIPMTTIEQSTELTEPYFLYSEDGTFVKGAQLDGSNKQTLLAKNCLLDFSYREQKLFCLSPLKSGSEIQTIDLQSKLTTTHTTELDIHSIAYDWIHNNIYCSVPKFGQVIVINLKTLNQTTLDNLQPEQPGALVLDPRDNQKWMYYIGDGQKIWKAGLDGSLNHALLSNETRPATRHALTLDFAANRLYWFSWSENKLESVGLDGKNRITVLTDKFLVGLHSIVQHDAFIYWTQLVTVPGDVTYLRRTRKSNVNLHGAIYIETLISEQPNSTGIRDVAVFSPSRQPTAVSACGANNGGCSHLCLPSPSTPEGGETHKCACPDELKLTSDKFNCG